MLILPGPFRRHIGCLLAAVLCLGPVVAGAQETEEAAPPPGGPPEARPYRIYMDFNNDEQKDLALTDASAWAAAGGTWQIYINTGPGRFQFAGQAFFHPLAFQVHGIKPGMGRLVACVRGEGSDARMVSYAINDAAVTETVSTPMKLGAFGNPDDLIKYDMLFGHLRKINYHIPFEPGDFEITDDGVLIVDPPEMLNELPEVVRVDLPPQPGEEAP